MEELLKATIDTAVQTQAVRPAEFERVIVDTTVQEKAIAHPVDGRLLEIARAKVVQAAKRVGIALKQTFVKEGKELRRKAGGYAHAKQFKPLRRTVRRQRTILGIVLREIKRKLATAISASLSAIAHLNTLLERAERIRRQQPKDKNKLYALHAPEVECIGKGKARKPHEFGVKANIAVTHKSGLMVGARTFPGNPYDGHLLSAQLEQTCILLEDVGRSPKEVVVDLGFRGLDRDNPPGGDHSPRQVQVADQATAPLAQAATGGGAGDWSPQVGSPDGSLLAPGPTGRHPACRAVRHRLQPALVAAGHAPSGPEGRFLAPSFTGADRALQWRSFPIQLDRSEFPLDQSTWMNFAGPTI